VRRKSAKKTRDGSVGGGGVALVAAKSYYFGVGGGARSFRARLEHEGDFAVECVRTLSDGASNVREILKVTWAREGDGV
jgi:hypothetical protein